MIKEITNKYFVKGTKGYCILFNYYNKYKSLFEKTIHSEFDDFLNQILLNISSIKFSDEIRNKEAYIIGSIKIQCRVQLDKALKQKNRIQIVKPEKNNNNTSEELIDNVKSENYRADTNLETREIFNAIQYFKNTIKFSEIELLNNLIDEIPRKEIALSKKVNINTLDTQIRRLRIKFMKFLVANGYQFKTFEKYAK